MTIAGSYDTYDELTEEQSTGTDAGAYLVDGELYVWSNDSDSWEDIGTLQGPIGATGPTGPTGASGTEDIGAAFLVTFDNNDYQKGIEVLTGERLPIDRLEVDSNNLCTLDENDNTIQFNKVGIYKISFMVNAYVNYLNDNFDSTVDFISIGFRNVDNDVIYAGASVWINDETAHQIVGNGVFEVTDISAPYELYNFSKRAIYLDSPGIENIELHSYFLNPVVTILIEYLG